LDIAKTNSALARIYRYRHLSRMQMDKWNDHWESQSFGRSFVSYYLL